MNGIYLLLGSNMGNRLEYLREAEQQLISAGIRVIDESSIYETAPRGKSEQAWFLNVILQVETSKTPEELLKSILMIEEQIGRIRTEKWGERSIDIDILYYRDETIGSSDLKVPHPGIPDRRFTLIPLVEMCPLKVHPVITKNHMQLLADCTDMLDCKLTDYKL